MVGTNKAGAGTQKPQPLAAVPATPKITAELHGTVQLVEPDRSVIPEQVFPFLSTVLWVGLIVGVLFVYRRHIRTFLIIVNDRLREGASLEFPYFKLGIRPQSPNQQRRRIEEEISAVAEDDAYPQAFRLETRDTLRSVYLTAEDLAMRDIQREFRSPITRQITSAGAAFDGVFTTNGITYLIEVKLVRNEKSDRVARLSTRQLARSIELIKAKNVRGLLAVVFDMEVVDLAEQRRRLLQAAENLSVSVDVRCYRLGDLRERYGAG